VTFPVTPDEGIHKHKPVSTQQYPIAAQQLQTWATNLLNSIVSQVVHILTFGLVPTGAVTTALTSLESWWGGFLNDVHSALTWKPNLPTTTISTNTRVSDVATAARTHRGDTTRSLTDLIPQARIPSIPVSHLGADNPNLLVGGGFDDAANFDISSPYAWDGTAGRTGFGTAKATGNGNSQILYSNAIAVLSGDTFTVGGYVRWANLYSTGTAIQLSLVTYAGTAVVSSTIICSVSGLTANATSVGWTSLSGNWNYDFTVSTTVTSIRLKLTVFDTVTAGTVWWDDISAYKTGILTGSLVSGLLGSGTIVDHLQGTLDSAVDGFNGTVGVASGSTIDSLRVVQRNQKLAADSAQLTANTADSIASGSLGSGSNLLANPSFEDTNFAILNDGVLASTTNIPAEPAHTGTKSLKLVMEIDTVNIVGSPTGGSFTLSFGGYTTVAIAYNASAAAVQTAFCNLASVGVGNATVIATPGLLYQISMSSALPYSAITATSSLTGGTSPTVVMSDTADRYSVVSVDTVGQVKFPCTQGEKVYLEAWVYGKTTNSQTIGGANGIVLGLLAYNSSGVIYPTSGLTVTMTAGTALNGGWTKLSGTVTIPSFRYSYSPFVSLLSSSVNAGETYYFDDIVVREVTVAAAAQLAAESAALDASDAALGTANLQTSLVAGYNVDTIASNTSWLVPDNISEIYIALFGGGGKGSSGGSGTNNQPGGAGGVNGGFISQQLDPSDATNPLIAGTYVTCTIGYGTTIGGQNTSFGSFLSTADAFKSYVATPLGLIATGANPTSGGSGGTTNGAGGSGGTTVVGVGGGSGGAGKGIIVTAATGNPGGSGNNGINFGLCFTGGSGGGGGGGVYSSASSGVIGGAGGSGGAPGGGGGGGGGGTFSSVFPGTGGTGGVGGQGLILIIYKTASTA